MNARFSKCLVSVLVIAALALAIVPFAGAQEGPKPAIVELTPYEGNPILPAEMSQWGLPTLARARVVYHNDLLHLFYTAYDNSGGSVGYATSEDGLHWTEYPDNPVFVPDETLAPMGVMEFGVFLDNETWEIYFTPWPEGREWWALADYSLVATAPGPTGPWTVASEPVLTADETGWNAGGRWIVSVIRVDDTYRMFYESSSLLIGMAESSNSVSWVKYDDPTTPDTPSDPIFAPSPDPNAWDSGYVTSPVVRQTEDGWEMFYGAGPADMSVRSIGYATSPDGINWTRQGDASLLTDPEKITCPDAVVEVEGKNYLYYTTYSGIKVATITYR